MSHKLISLSPDLKRLQDEGYNVDVRAGHLIIRDVPYVTTSGQVSRGTLASTLQLAGDRTTIPGTHVAMFSDTPCHSDGRPITEIIHQSSIVAIEPGLVMTHSFSSKPVAGYADYYEKMVTYIRILSSAAQAIEPQISAQTNPVVADEAENSPFHYVDTASSRAQITAIADKLAKETIAIVGLGGTGSYVLDLVAKTPVRAIHIFDGDDFLQHNAFRSPGAATINELRAKKKKVEFLAGIYSNMHRNIIPHPDFISESNINDLKAASFAFICIDSGASKRMILGKLAEFGTSYIDVGMGLYVANEQVHGLLRTTTSTRDMRDHVGATVTVSDAPGDDLYRTNIQVADLNALNGALAVVKWKKLRGFYGDTDREHSSLYVLAGNVIINEDKA